MPGQKRRGFFLAVRNRLLELILVAFLIFIGKIMYWDSPSRTAPLADNGRDAAGGNATIDEMINLPPEGRAAAFMRVFKAKNDSPCDEITRTFFAGLEPTTGDGFWSVGCRDGHQYQVAVQRDSQEAPRVLSCEMLKAMGNLGCFTSVGDTRGSRPPR